MTLHSQVSHRPVYRYVLDSDPLILHESRCSDLGGVCRRPETGW